MCVGGESPVGSWNGGRAEMPLPRQPEWHPDGDGEQSVPNRWLGVTLLSPGPGRLTAHYAARLSFVASWSQEYSCRSFRFR